MELHPNGRGNCSQAHLAFIEFLWSCYSYPLAAGFKISKAATFQIAFFKCEYCACYFMFYALFANRNYSHLYSLWICFGKWLQKKFNIRNIKLGSNIVECLTFFYHVIYFLNKEDNLKLYLALRPHCCKLVGTRLNCIYLINMYLPSKL